MTPREAVGAAACLAAVMLVVTLASCMAMARANTLEVSDGVRNISAGPAGDCCVGTGYPHVGAAATVTGLSTLEVSDGVRNISAGPGGAHAGDWLAGGSNGDTAGHLRVAAGTGLAYWPASLLDGDADETPAPLVVVHLSGPAVALDHPEAQRYLAIEPWLTEAVWRVAWCESAYRPAVVNPSGATGFMQVHRASHEGKAHAAGYEWADMRRLLPNLWVAHIIWQAQGWGPWSCKAWR